MSEPAFHYEELDPSPELRTFVKCFWVLHDSDTAGEIEKVLPDGCPEVIFHFGDSFAEVKQNGSGKQSLTVQTNAIVTGQLTSPLLLKPTGSVGMIGIRFWPHGLFPVLGESMSQLTNQRLSIVELGEPWPTLAEQIREQTNTVDRVAACEATIKSCLNPNRIDEFIVQGVARLLDTNGNVPINDLARDLTVGRRRLERKFKDQIGISPQELAGLIRFRGILERLETPGGDSWAALAFDCGYFDQPHLARSFKKFAGESLTSYCRSASLMTQTFAGTEI